MSRPSNASLYRDALRDLVADIRCAERWVSEGHAEEQSYADKCRAELGRLWAARAAARVDRWGYPEGGAA